MLFGRHDIKADKIMQGKIGMETVDVAAKTYGSQVLSGTDQGSNRIDSRAVIEMKDYTRSLRNVTQIARRNCDRGAGGAFECATDDGIRLESNQSVLLSS